ncbi:MAG: hypothetical protein JWQ12_1748 [Glaciihabitans sp.]|nr:hypothetical protein [Glaciihabitans sp.]
MFYSLSFWHLIVVVAMLALLVGVVIAITQTLRDNRLRTSDKATWIVVLLVLPVIGLGSWLIIRGMNARKNRPAPSV